MVVLLVPVSVLGIYYSQSKQVFHFFSHTILQMVLQDKILLLQNHIVLLFEYSVLYNVFVLHLTLEINLIAKVDIMFGLYV